MIAGICDLAPPGEIAPELGISPGTVFLVLAGSRPDSVAFCPEIVVDDSGAVSVDGRLAERWEDLVQGCLTGC